MLPTSTATAELPPLRITFGADNRGAFDVGLPVLAGESVENLFHTAQPAGEAGALSLFRANDWLLGAATLPLTMGLGFRFFNQELCFTVYLSIFVLNTMRAQTSMPPT